MVPLMYLTSSILILSIICSSHGEHLNIYALEKGVIVEELVDVKPDAETIKIVMPAHNNLDKMTLIADFKRNLTMRRMVDFNICYLTKLDRSQFPLPKTLDGIAKYEKSVQPVEELWLNTPNITYSYIIHPELFTKIAYLSEEMQELCDGIPIKLMVMVNESPDDVQVTENGIELIPLDSVFASENGNRKKRQSFCPPDDEKAACLIQNKFCHYIASCELIYNTETRSDEEKCDKKHEFGKARCCRTCCNVPDMASEEIPVCKTLTSNDMFKFCKLES